MQLLLTIATLCQVISYTNTATKCHQSYLHCVNVKKASGMVEHLALEKCIMEKK